MRNPLRIVIFMLAATVLAAFLAGWAGVEIGLLTTKSDADVDSAIHRGLRLTPQQEARVASLEQEFRAQRSILHKEMRDANQALARAITQDRVYGSTARRAVERLQAAMGELQTRTVQHVLAMRETLTPAQAREFDSKVATALGAEPE